MSEDKHESAVKTILELGEEKMGEVVNQLLSNEAFVGAVQRAITGGLGAKRTVDKGMATLLGMVNIPTLEDVEKVRSRLGEVEEALGEMATRLEKIHAAIEARGPRGKKGT